jgi:hypothetical protein
MAKKVAKKTKTKTKTKTKLPKLPKDFDVVAHVIPVYSDETITIEDEKCWIHSIYINKFGDEIGALVSFEDGGYLSLSFETWNHINSPEAD